ncbi:MAG: heavy-metal-associated domain-containing protein [Firmicutes bacterium]|jgi:copper chaperone|nr:heavy-metal-associated domain-containing protein [Bacillota bacterium]
MPANQETVILRVEEMSCEHCKKSVEGALQALPGVSGAAVDLKKKEVKVTFDPAMLRREELENAITRAGYTVTG